MNTKNIAVVVSIAMLTASGVYLFTMTTLIPGWSEISMGNQLLIASPAGFLWANVVAILKTI